MTTWRIRDYHSNDVDGVLRLWEQIATDTEPVYSLSEVLASCAKDHAVVDNVSLIGAELEVDDV